MLGKSIGTLDARAIGIRQIRTDMDLSILNLWQLLLVLLLAPLPLLAYQAIALNRLVKRRDRLWLRIMGRLRERHALAPKLTAIASLYYAWNDPLLDGVTVARKHAMVAHDVADQSITEAELSWALARLILAAQSHPELVRHADFATITRCIDDVELQVAQMRQEYNRYTALIGDRMSHVGYAVWGSAIGIRAGEPFELDPLLARQAMMAQVQSQHYAG